MAARARTLCVGIDVTWFGGSPRRRSSQHETLVSALVGEPDSFALSCVDLHTAPNPRAARPTEPSFDADGALLLAALDEVLDDHAGRFNRLVVALDAPLEAKRRPGQPARRRAVGKGERAGSERRECEAHLQRHMSDVVRHGPARAWNPGLKIQSGSPIPARIHALVEALRERGCPAYRGGKPPARTVLEVFPSEAIWALGVAGHYGRHGSDHVRAYKAKQPRTLAPAEARKVAAAPLAGFVPVLVAGGLAKPGVDAWTRKLVAHVCKEATRADGEVGKGKRFDDVIDSGLAFLTAVAFATGQAHVWGDGHDGAIVGPVRLPGVPMP